MTDFKIFYPCSRPLCPNKKRRCLYVAKRYIKIPTGHTARSQDLICNKCYKLILSQFGLK